MMSDVPTEIVHRIASEFHATYERLAPQFNYSTQPETAVPWDEVPKNNKALMVAVVADLMKRGIIDTHL